MRISPTQRSLAPLCAMCLIPISALAHTGVGVTSGFSSGFSHPIGGADHLLAMLAVGFWAVQLGGRAIWAVPTAFVTMMLLGVALAAFGIPVPYFEQGVLVSVLVLGVLIAGAFRFRLAPSVVLVGVFAVFHGHAHGAEMPLATGAVSYCLGLALATASLHAVGIAAGATLQQLNIEKLTRLAGVAVALAGTYFAVL